MFCNIFSVCLDLSFSNNEMITIVFPLLYSSGVPIGGVRECCGRLFLLHHGRSPPQQLILPSPSMLHPDDNKQEEEEEDEEEEENKRK